MTLHSELIKSRYKSILLRFGTSTPINIPNLITLASGGVDDAIVT